MPTLEAIKQWLLFFGLSIPPLVIAIILALYVYPNARVLLGDILRVFGWTGKWIRRKSVESEVEGSINLFSKSINAELIDDILPACEIKWVTSDNQQNILEPGKAIVCLSFGPDHDLNYYNAVSAFVQTGLLPHAKPFLKRATGKAIDLLMTKILLIKSRRNALKIFNNKFREEPTDSKEVYIKLEETERSGLYSRILLQEYNAFGEIIGDKAPNNIYEKESEKFLEWFHDLAMRTTGDKTALKFEGEHIRVGVILIAKEETYQEHGIEPYLKWATYYALNNYGAIYLLSRGERRAQLTKGIAQELSSKRGFAVLSKHPDIIKKGISENIFITCIALKPDVTAIVQQAWEYIQSAYVAQKQISVIISHVAIDEVTVDAYGLSVKMPLSNLSAMRLNDATKYFAAESELLVRIISCEPQKNEIILSNIDTDTDPQKLVDKNLSASTPIECIVKKISSGDGLEYGIIIEDVEDRIRGFIPRSRATFSRFILLKDKYPLGTIVKVNIIDFSVERASYICKIADLRDPWDDIGQYKEEQRVQVIIREVTERYLTCELQEGLEGRLFVEDLSWGTTKDNSEIIKHHKVGESLSVIISHIVPGFKRIHLSIKRLSVSPVQKYVVDHRNKIASATVNKIRPLSGVEVIIDDNSYNGFVPIREIMWGYCENISECVTIGQKVSVSIMDYDQTFNNIIVSIKRSIPNNYSEFKAAFKINDEVNGRVVACGKDRCIVKIEFAADRQVTAYVHKSELTTNFYVDESIIQKILDNEKVYTFTIKRFDDIAQIMELSRKKYLLNKFQSIQYGQEFEAKVIHYKGINYVYANEVEGILVSKGKYKIAGGQYIQVVPARIDVEMRRLEVHQAQ